MKEIIENKGTNFQTFDDSEKKVVAEAMAMAGAIKTLLDTPILSEEGTLTEESEQIANLTRERISTATNNV